MEKTQEKEITLIDIYRYLIGNVMLVAQVTVLTVFLSLIYVLFIMEEIYQADALVQPVSSEQSASAKSSVLNQLGGLAGFSSLTSMNSLGTTQGSLATMQSRLFILDFIEENKIAPILFPNQWDQSKNNWIKVSPSDWDIFNKFKKSLTVTMDLQSGLYTISIKYSDGELAADWVNKLIYYLNLHLRNSAINESKKSIKYLEDELKSTSQEEIKDAIFMLIQQQMTTAMLANVQEEYAFKILDPAVAPQNRLGIPRSQMMIISGILGILIGLILAFIKGYFFEEDS